MDFNIYLIGDKNFFESEKRYLEVLNKCFDGGVRAFQLRQKDVAVREFISLGEKIKKITDKYKDVKLFVNDRIDVALALEAYGVHLNKNSIPIKAVKEKAKNLKVFYSSHSVCEVITAQDEGADAVTFSPIFKIKNQDFEQGVGLLKKAVNLAGIPVFALGGINKRNIGRIRDAGAKYIAVQSGILMEDDIYGTVKFLSENLS
ncbi:MAG: thiamine phosphate synthase [Deltaproteobacteria bacterium]|nr:thiamine phosphate synthase [Deltaproteobacteria bacterium]